MIRREREREERKETWPLYLSLGGDGEAASDNLKRTHDTALLIRGSGKVSHVSQKDGR